LDNWRPIRVRQNDLIQICRHVRRRVLNAWEDQHLRRSGHSVLLEYHSTLLADAGRARRVSNHVQATSRNDGNMSEPRCQCNQSGQTGSRPAPGLAGTPNNAHGVLHLQALPVMDAELVLQVSALMKATSGTRLPYHCTILTTTKFIPCKEHRGTE